MSKSNPAGLIGSARFFTSFCAAALVLDTAKAEDPVRPEFSELG
jgi:hypothetical protein